MVYYYLIHGQKRGPVSFADLQASARRGGLLPEDLVWAPNLVDWSPAANVSGLFPGLAPSTRPDGQEEGKQAAGTGSRVTTWAVSAILVSILALLVLVLLANLRDREQGGQEGPPAAPRHETLQGQAHAIDV